MIILIEVIRINFVFVHKNSGISIFFLRLLDRPLAPNEVQIFFSRSLKPRYVVLMYFLLLFLLYRPLAPNEVLPTRTHYEARSKPSEENSADLVADSPGKKAASKKTKRDKSKKHEKKTKKKEVKKETTEENLFLDLIDPLEGVTVVPEAPVAANHMNGILETESENLVAVSEVSLFNTGYVCAWA